MRYFVGCAPTRFDADAGQAAIQIASYSLENLKAAPHALASPCAASAPPCFHTGSVITMEVPEDALGVGRTRQRNIKGWVSRKAPKKDK